MSINRRDFLKLGAAGATTALAGSSVLASSAHFEGYPDAIGILVDTTLCLGENCRRCEQACKGKNERELQDLDLHDNSVFEKRRRTDANNYTVVNRYDDPREEGKHIFVKTQCMHCVEPACASACLVKAFTKQPEGPVTYNKDVCIGCRYCMVACPFSIPAYEFFNAWDPQVRKCTMCYDRIKEGQKPACVDVCPQETMVVGKRTDLIRLAHERIRKNPDRYHPYLYGEDEVGGTSWLYMAGVDQANLGFNMELGNGKYGELTTGPLGIVPIILIAWPLLLTGLHKTRVDNNHDKQAQITHDHEGGH